MQATRCLGCWVLLVGMLRTAHAALAQVVVIDLGTLGPGTATAVSNSGQVVGCGIARSGETHPFSWTAAGGIVDLGILGGIWAEATAVNENGQVVGGFNLATTTSDWHVAGIADFNGDHISDILWHNDGGQNLIWQMQPNGAPPVGSVLPLTPVEWHVLDVGDFTGDGTADIFWHNDGGQNLVWQIQNSQIVGGFNLPTTTSEWHVV